jgi:hypothetical protein
MRKTRDYIQSWDHLLGLCSRQELAKLKKGKAIYFVDTPDAGKNPDPRFHFITKHCHRMWGERFGGGQFRAKAPVDGLTAWCLLEGYGEPYTDTSEDNRKRSTHHAHPHHPQGHPP